MEESDEQEQQDRVNGQGPGGDETIQTITEDHQEHDQQDADQSGTHGGRHSVLTEGGGHFINLLLGQFQRQGTGLDLGGNAGRLFLGVVAGDDAVAVQDCGLDSGVNQLFTVQLNDQVLTDIGGGDFTEDLGAFFIQFKGDLMTFFAVAVNGLLDHVAGHEDFAVGSFELHLSGSADQVQYGIVLNIRDFNTDAVSAQLLDIGFIVALVRQTGADNGHGTFAQAVEVRGGTFRSFAGIFNIHTAPQVKTQRQGFRPVLGIGGGQPGQNLVQSTGRQAYSGDTDHAKCDGDDEQHAQRDDGSGFAANALIAGFHIDRFLLRKHS